MLNKESGEYRIDEEKGIFSVSNDSRYFDFYKEDENHKIWTIEEKDSLGKFLFSFDKMKIYNFWEDYPINLTEEEKNIFDIEFPMMSRLKS